MTSLPAGRHPALVRLVKIARVAVLVLVLAAVAYAVVHEWPSVRGTVKSLSWQSIVLALTSILLGMSCTVAVWQHVLDAVDVRLGFVGVAQVNLVGQLGKYLPGSVWAFVLQAELGRRYQVPRARALVAMLVSAAMSIVTALALSVLALPSLLDKWGDAAWLLALGPLGLISMHPRVLTFMVNLVLHLMRRPKLEVPIQARQILLALSWSFASWLLFGVQLWALASSLGRLSLGEYFLVTGAFALAMSAGFVAFVLPSGVGVREAVIVAGLSPILAAGPALALALTSRLLFAVCDVAGAGLSVLAGRFVTTEPARLGLTSGLSEQPDTAQSS